MSEKCGRSDFSKHFLSFFQRIVCFIQWLLCAFEVNLHFVNLWAQNVHIEFVNNCKKKCMNEFFVFILFAIVCINVKANQIQITNIDFESFFIWKTVVQ